MCGSPYLDGAFCIDILEEAITGYGGPEIFNTDQGGQFTTEVFINVLRFHGVAISMDGKGCWRDNIFIRTAAEECNDKDIYLKAYGSMAEVRRGAAFQVLQRKTRASKL